MRPWSSRSALTLVATLVAIFDLSIKVATGSANAGLPASGVYFVETLIVIGAIGMGLAYVARQTAKLKYRDPAKPPGENKSNDYQPPSSQ